MLHLECVASANSGELQVQWLTTDKKAAQALRTRSTGDDTQKAGASDANSAEVKKALIAFDDLHEELQSSIMEYLFELHVDNEYAACNQTLNNTVVDVLVFVCCSLGQYVQYQSFQLRFRHLIGNLGKLRAFLA